MEEGQVIAGKPKLMTLAHMRKFSGHLGGGENPHTNEEMARLNGFPAPTAQGMMSFGYILELLLATFGNGWLNGGELTVSFLRYVHPGDTITAKGLVRRIEKTGKGNRVSLEVWCENQRGEKTTVGRDLVVGLI